MSQPQTTAESSRPPLPRLWARFSVPAGSAIQLAGIAAGGALLIAAAHAGKAAAIMLMAAGFLAVYLCSHAIAHVAVGRAVGIRFRAYGVRGTDHPEMYPPGVRQVMSALPMWTALTEKNSMRSASRPARAAMFAAGETSTSVFSLAAAGYAAHAGIPGGRALLVGTILWTIASTITVAIVPKGDYAKALRALGWRKPLSSSQPSPEQTQRARTWGPDRRGPRRKELRNAVVGWSLVNALLVALWARAGGGFPWFLFVTVPSALGVGSWALQGRREAAAHQD